jgi:type IV fimbrial biogenesis protein FimT
VRRFFLATASSHGDFRFRLRQAGYSLYDLMITSSLVSVLGIGAAGMTSMVQDARMTAGVNQLMAELSLARSEAIKRGTAVSLCRSGNGQSCSDKSEWKDGWIIFTDLNKNHQVDGDEKIIRAQQDSLQNTELRYGGEIESYAYLTYYPAGYARPNATFTFCDRRGSEKAKAVIINTVGRPRSSTRSYENKPLVCP